MQGPVDVLTGPGLVQLVERMELAKEQVEALVANGGIIEAGQQIKLAYLDLLALLDGEPGAEASLLGVALPGLAAAEYDFVASINDSPLAQEFQLDAPDGYLVVGAPGGGVWTRRLRTNEDLDPFMFGAVGNATSDGSGGTDDAAAIQRCLDAARASAAFSSGLTWANEKLRYRRNREVYMPNAAFRVNSGLVCPHVSVTGPGFLIAGADNIAPVVYYEPISRFLDPGTGNTEAGVFGARRIKVEWNIDGAGRPGVGLQMDNVSKAVYVNPTVLNFQGPRVAGEVRATQGTGNLWTFDTPYAVAGGMEVVIGDNPLPFIALYPDATDPGNRTVWRMDRNPVYKNVALDGVTQASPAVVTSGGHYFEDGDEVLLYDIVGMAALDDGRYIVRNPAPGVSFELYEADGVTPVDTTASGGFVSGSALRVYTNAVSKVGSVGVHLTHVNQCDVAGIYNGNDRGLAITRWINPENGQRLTSNGFRFDHPSVQSNARNLYLSHVQDALGYLMATNSLDQRDIDLVNGSGCDLWNYCELAAALQWNQANPGQEAKSPYLNVAVNHMVGFGGGNHLALKLSDLGEFAWLLETDQSKNSLTIHNGSPKPHPVTGSVAFVRMPASAGSVSNIDMRTSISEQNPVEWVAVRHDESQRFDRGVRAEYQRFDDHAQVGNLMWLSPAGLSESMRNNRPFIGTQVVGETQPRMLLTERGEARFGNGTMAPNNMARLLGVPRVQGSETRARLQLTSVEGLELFLLAGHEHAMVFGFIWLWFWDNALRIKVGPPTSDTDGEVLWEPAA